MSTDTLSPEARAMHRSRLWHGVTWVVFFVSIVAIPFETVMFSAALYFVAAFALLMANLQAFLVVLLIIVRFAVVVISISTIEMGAYVSEQFRYGFVNGSTALYVPYLILFIFAFHFLTLKFAGRFIDRINLEGAPLRRYFWLLVIGYVGLNAAFLLTIGMYGTAASIGGDRFVYWNHLPDAVRANVMFVRSWVLSSLAVFFGFYARYVRRPPVLLYALYGLTFVELYLMGEKFAALFNNFFLFLTGFALAAIVTRKHIRLRLSMILVAAAVVVGLYFALDAGYQQLSGGRADSVESIRDRIVLEAHVWFGIMDLGQGLPVADFIDMWKLNTPTTPSGLDFLSYLVTTPEYVAKRLSGGIPFTMGGAPAALAVFGAFGGMLFFALEATLYPLVGLLFLSFLRARMLTVALVSLIGYNLIMLTAVMGYWDVYHSRTAYVWLATIIGGQLIIATRKAKQRDTEMDQPIDAGWKTAGR